MKKKKPAYRTDDHRKTPFVSLRMWVVTKERIGALAQQFGCSKAAVIDVAIIEFINLVNEGARWKVEHIERKLAARKVTRGRPRKDKTL